MKDSLRRKVDDAEVEGWKLHEEQGEHRAVMIKRKYGSLGAHILIAILTAWWTFFLGNVIYAAYKFFADADKKVLRSDEEERKTS